MTYVDEKLWTALSAMCQKAQDTLRSDLPHTIGTLPNGIEVTLIDGDEVKVAPRGKLKSGRDDDDFMDFVEGGNGEEDPGLCDKRQIVVDWNLRPHTWAFIAYHEEREREGMAGGMDYEEAHARSNREERALRLRARA